MSGVVNDWEGEFESMSEDLGLSDRFHCAQQAIGQDNSGMVSIIGGRRSGKTELMVGKALELANKFPGEIVPYLGPTLRGVLNLVSPKVREIMARTGIKFSISPGNFTITTPSGGMVQLFGLATLPDAEKGRGYRYPGIFCDEAGACSQKTLQLAITETFGPATADFHGKGGEGIWIAGTPPYHHGSYFEDLCGGNEHKSKFGATVHHMTIFDNPFFAGREQAVIDKWLKNNALTKESSKFQREWMGRFCVDSLGLAHGRWDGVVLPHSHVPLRGVTVLGLDLGHTAPNSWVVIRICPKYELCLDDPSKLVVKNIVHVLQAFEENGLSTDQIADRTRQFMANYNCGILYGDGGGGGLQTISDLQNRFNLPFQNYKTLKGKGPKLARIIDIDGMLGNRTMVVHEHCGPLIEQLKSVPWNDERTGYDERFPCHSLDALIYAVTHDFSRITTEAIIPPEPGTPEWDTMLHERDVRIMQRGY